MAFRTEKDLGKYIILVVPPFSEIAIDPGALHVDPKLLQRGHCLMCSRLHLILRSARGSSLLHGLVPGKEAGKTNKELFAKAEKLQSETTI